jgi:hypothetical protein
MAFSRSVFPYTKGRELFTVGRFLGRRRVWLGGVVVCCGLIVQSAWAAEAEQTEPPPEPLPFYLQPVVALQSALADDFWFSVAGFPVFIGISGRITRAFLHGDNGEDSEFFFVDNNNSSTRVVGVAEATLSDTLLIGSSIKLPLIFQSSTSVDFGDADSFSGSFGEAGERDIDGYLTSATYGKLYVGYGDTASDGTSEVDKSGTTVISRSRVRDLAGGLSFSGGPRIKDVFDNFDGLGSEKRVRYDTPTFDGTIISASVTTERDYDIAIRFDSGQFGDALAVAAAYAHKEDGSDQVSTSASATWKSGASLSLAAAWRDQNDRTKLFGYAKAGYRRDFFSFGPTAFAIDAAYNEDVDQKGDKAYSAGAFAIQTINREGIVKAVDLYIGVRWHELDRRDDNFDDILATMAGFRVRF